jgi:DNA-directed RNA polymerase subunit RPC12/RpoP
LIGLRPWTKNTRWLDTWSGRPVSKPKKDYLVVVCTHCGRLLLAVSDKKTRSCPYCGRRVNLKDARVIAHSKNPKEARQVLQEMKTQEQHPKANTNAERR